MNTFYYLKIDLGTKTLGKHRHRAGIKFINDFQVLFIVNVASHVIPNVFPASYISNMSQEIQLVSCISPIFRYVEIELYLRERRSSRNHHGYCEVMA